MIINPYDGGLNATNLAEITEEDSYVHEHGKGSTDHANMIDDMICVEKQFNIL